MNVLYITYDGLTDFIGQSQVLPYLIGTAEDRHNFTVISFEKADRHGMLGPKASEQLANHGIDWLPQRFRSSPPYVAKAIDQFAMRRAAFDASRRKTYGLIHCRSYPAAVVGLSIKQRFGTPLLFDMRGFWPDQRREGGRWPRHSPIGNWLFRRWKSHEARLIEAADHIVVLTQAAKLEIEGWAAYRGAPISVIPCCADFDIFGVAEPRAALDARRRLGIGADNPVLGYLGSIGTVYMIGDHLRLFAAIKRRDDRAKALFIGRNQAAEILAAASDLGIGLAPDDLIALSAERKELPFWLGAIDVGTCFVTPGYSSKGVSPTKLAEYLACGIPVIANAPVGDVETIVKKLDAGHVIPGFDEGGLEVAADAFFRLRSVDREALRQRSRPFDLPVAVEAYKAIYRDIGTAVDAGLR